MAGVSVGGGEIEMTELEGFPVCLRGNEDGALFIGPDGLGRAVFEERLGALSGFSCVKDGERALYLCLAEKPFPDGMDMPGLEMFPVRNILGNKLADAEPLFSTLAAMAEMAGGDLPGLIERYEARRSGVDRDTIRAAVLGSWEIMKASMTDGLAGKSDMLAGLVPGDAGFRLARRVESGQALSGRTIGMAVARALAVMENNGSMRCVVAAPTAGACGVLPGAFLSAAEERGLGDDAIVDRAARCGGGGRARGHACPHFRGDRRLPVRNRRGFGHDGGGAGAAWRRDSGTGYPRGGHRPQESSRAHLRSCGRAGGNPMHQAQRRGRLQRFRGGGHGPCRNRQPHSSRRGGRRAHQRAGPPSSRSARQPARGLASTATAGPSRMNGTHE